MRLDDLGKSTTLESNKSLVGYCESMCIVRCDVSPVIKHWLKSGTRPGRFRAQPATRGGLVKASVCIRTQTSTNYKLLEIERICLPLHWCDGVRAYLCTGAEPHRCNGADI